jgi:hypothetical protein
MNTKHTPQIVDFNDPKKAIRALKGSIDDAFLLLNRHENTLGNIRNDLGSFQTSIDATILQTQQNTGSVQPLNSNLNAIAGLTFAANNVILLTGPGATSIGKVTNAYLGNLGTQYTLPMFGATGLADSIVSQNAGATEITVGGNHQINFGTGSYFLGEANAVNYIQSATGGHWFTGANSSAALIISNSGNGGWGDVTLNGYVNSCDFIFQAAAAESFRISGADKSLTIYGGNKLKFRDADNAIYSYSSGNLYIEGLTSINFRVGSCGAPLINAFSVAESGTAVAELKWLNAGTGYLKITADVISVVSSCTASAHNLLSAIHGDSSVGAATRGNLIRGSATATWEALAKGTAGAVLTCNANDTLWSTFYFSGTAAQTYTFPATTASIVGGSGTQYYIPVWNNAGGTTLGNSEIQHLASSYTDPVAIGLGTSTTVAAFLGGYYTAGSNTANTYITSNAYFNGSSWIIPNGTSNTAGYFLQNGVHSWYTGTTTLGTAKMSLTNAGILTINSGCKLQFNDASTNTFIGQNVYGNVGILDITYPTTGGVRCVQSASLDGAMFQVFGGTNASYPGQMYFDYGSYARTIANCKILFRLMTLNTITNVMTFNSSGEVSLPLLNVAGLLHNSAAGLISTSLLVAADVTNNTLTNTQLANLGTAGVFAKYATNGLANSLLSENATGTITMNEGTSHYSTMALVHTTATGYTSFSAVNDNLSSSLVSTVYGHSSAGGTHCGLAEASLARIYSYSPVALLIDMGQSVPIVFGIAGVAIASVSSRGLSLSDAYQNCIVSTNFTYVPTGTYNAAFGYEAMRLNQTSAHNAGFGTQALYHLASGAGYNAAIGDGAGQHFTGGEGNDNATGTYSVFLGASTLAHANGETNQIVIGYGATGNGSNTATYGNSSITSHVFTAGAITMNGTLCGLTAGQIPMGSASTGLTASVITQASNNITINGSVGIGVTSPGFKLSVAQDMTMGSDVTDGTAQMVIQGSTTSGKKLLLGYDTNNNGFGFIKAGNQGIAWTALALQPNGGNVGIGTTGPGSALDVYSSVPELRLRDSGNSAGDGGVLTFWANAGTDELARVRSYLYDSTAGAEKGYLIFSTMRSGTMTEAARIMDNGSVGIGCTPTSLLHVAGPIALGTPKNLSSDYYITAYPMIATDSTLIFSNVAGHTQIITLQAASSYPGRILFIKCYSPKLVSDANNVILKSGGAAQADILYQASDGTYWAILQSDGTNWQVISIG